MNFLAVAELTALLFLTVFVLRALIGVRREYRMREGRHMQSAIDESRSLEVVPNLLEQPIASPRRKLDWKVYGSVPMNRERRRLSAPAPKSTRGHVRKNMRRI